MAKMHKCDCLFVIFILQCYNCRSTIAHNGNKKKKELTQTMDKTFMKLPIYR